MQTSIIKKINWTGNACIGFACEDLKKDLARTAGVEVVSDYYCVVESGAITVGTVETEEYVELVKPYFDRMPSAWEEYAVNILSDRIVIVGVDKRAAMWGIYSISKRLGVLPASPFTETVPAKCEELGEGVYWDRPMSYKFRGWFLNDEDLLCKWHLGGGTRVHDYRYYDTLTDVSTLVPIVETALRMGINLIIPASLLDIDDPRQEKLVAYCASRGLYVSQHHIEPLGVSHWNYAAYYKKQAKQYPFSFVTEKERAIEVWKHYAKKWAKYEDVIWQLGLRGKGDRPVWDNDQTQNSKEQWGKVISEAIRTQYDIVKELRGENFYSTTTLWAEGASLHAGGYLTFPENMIIVFSDVGATQMMSSDFYNMERKSDRDYGMYYHVAFWGDGPHLAVGNNPRKMLYNYTQALNYGDNAYSILNVSNIRELIMSVTANSKLVWDKDTFDVDAFYTEWCRDYYGNEDLARLFDDYFECFMVFEREETQNALSSFFQVHWQDTDFSYYPANDGRVRMIGLKALGGQKLSQWIPRLEESILRFRSFYERASKLEAAPYFAFFAFQSRYMMLLETWVLNCCRYAEDGDKRYLPQAAEALRTYLKERRTFETGMFANWYRGDDKMALPKLLEKTESYL